MKERTVLFVGFQSKVDALRAAQEEGLRVVLLLGSDSSGFEDYVDKVFRVQFDDVPGLKAALNQIKKEENVEAVFTNYEIYTVYKAFVAQYLGLEGAKLADACSARNKLMMRKQWENLEQNIDFRRVMNIEEARKAFLDFGEDVYLKFISGVKSSLIYHVRSLQEMEESFLDLRKRAAAINPAFLDFYDGMDFDFHYPDPRREFLVEKAEYGKQVTVASVVGAEGEIFHAPGLCDVVTAKEIARNDSFLAFRVLPGNKGDEVEKKVQKVLDQAIKDLGVKNALVHSELIICDDGSIKLIEIAARVGGYRAKMYEHAYGVNLHKLLFRLVLKKEEPEFILKGHKFVSVSEIFPTEEGVYKRLAGLDDFLKDESLVDHRFLVQKGDEIGKARDGHKRILDFMLEGESYEEVFERSLELQKVLTVLTEESE